MNIAGSSKYTLKKRTGRKGPCFGIQAHMVCLREQRAVSCQLLKGLWSFGGISSHLYYDAPALGGSFYSIQLRTRACVFWVISLLKSPLINKINYIWLHRHHLSETDLAWNFPSSHWCQQNSGSEGPCLHCSLYQFISQQISFITQIQPLLNHDLSALYCFPVN